MKLHKLFAAVTGRMSPYFSPALQQNLILATSILYSGQWPE